MDPSQVAQWKMKMLGEAALYAAVAVALVGLISVAAEKNDLGIWAAAAGLAAASLRLLVSSPTPPGPGD